MFKNWAKKRNEIQVGKKIRSKVMCCHRNFVFTVYNLRIGNLQIGVGRNQRTYSSTWHHSPQHMKRTRLESEQKGCKPKLRNQHLPFWGEIATQKIQNLTPSRYRWLILVWDGKCLVCICYICRLYLYSECFLIHHEYIWAS